MTSLLADVRELDYLIRQMEKIESKMKVGHFIPAFRDLCRIRADLVKAKEDLIKNNSNTENT